MRPGAGLHRHRAGGLGGEELNKLRSCQLRCLRNTTRLDASAPCAWKTCFAMSTMANPIVLACLTNASSSGRSTPPPSRRCRRGRPPRQRFIERHGFRPPAAIRAEQLPLAALAALNSIRCLNSRGRYSPRSTGQRKMRGSLSGRTRPKSTTRPTVREQGGSTGPRTGQHPTRDALGWRGAWIGISNFNGLGNVKKCIWG